MKLLFAGDVVLKEHSKIREKNLLGKKLYNLVGEQDIACCDLECPIYISNQTEIPKRGPSDYNEEKCLERLSLAGFNMVTMANNHIMDYGKRGLENTINKLKDNGHFRYIGAGMTENEIYRIEKIQDEENKIVIGIISVAETSFGTSHNGNPGCARFLGRKMEELLRRGKKECNYLIVVCHGGAEELNVPLPEFRDVYKSFIDIGADLIIAHHPHVIQGREIYAGKEIYYSLGNFAYDTEISGKPYNPMGLCVCADIDSKGIGTKAYTVGYADGQVEIMDSDDLFIQACLLLQNTEKYINTVNEFCIGIYQKYFRTYYALVIGLNILSEDDMQEFIEHRWRGDDIRWDDLFVYHNIAIETNRWICERAIRLINKI